MKIVISIPEPIFAAAEELAGQLGMSRSELYTTAVSHYLASFQDEAVTQALNKLYGDSVATVAPILYRMQFLALLEEAW